MVPETNCVLKLTHSLFLRPLFPYDADRAHHRPASDWRRCHQYAVALAIPLQWHVIFDIDAFAWAAHAHARAADAEPLGCH